MSATLAWQRRHAPKLVFALILLLATLLRFSHLDIAHFQLDQSRTAQLVWDIARAGKLHSYYFPFTGGYHGFPLPLYLWTPGYLASNHIHALLIWNIAFSLIALALTWFFVQRYWSWRVAAVATLLFATAPWHVWYAHRLWSLMQMSPFVLLWLCGTVFAIHEKRVRFWSLSWGMAFALVQLHASGVIFVFANAFLWLFVASDLRSWRWSAIGALLAALPAVPWLIAHLSGEISIQVDKLPLVGVGKSSLQYSLSPLFDFLAATEWRQWFRGGDTSRLAQVFRPLELVAAPLLLATACSLFTVLWRAWRGQSRILYRVLALWLILPIALFPFVTYEANMLVYYYPLLPAPFIAIALAWRRLPKRPKQLAGIAIVCLCIVQSYAVIESANVIRSAVNDDDASVWAVGGGAPLSQQLAIADLARELVDAGDASELFLLIRPVHRIEHEHLSHALPLLYGAEMRILDANKPNRVFPAQPSLWLFNDQNNAWLPEYTAASEIARSGPYRLYRMPAASPRPERALLAMPAFANGIKLLGYDLLACAAPWTLHWTPGPRHSHDSSLHFFARLLDENDAIIAGADLLAYEPGYWREGDHIVTSFDFDAQSAESSIATIRVGLYRVPSAADAPLENIYALDENGNPWLYAIDLPYRMGCIE